uniref:WSC domain-containing protein n=1 Tax=Pyrodinium bahamense TaxID=73915 RepID=A0A7S0FHF7_9DINO|mmetsp:Transcript_322/g.804  ORF Transcript_322/g.804 Transcript_322/m.804 type:complete len:500 (+) Transcript_322:43-1542(+)
MARAALLLLASLLVTRAAAFRGRRTWPQVPRLHHASLATIPVRRYAQDCWKHRPVSLALNSQAIEAGTRLPGAGMEPGSITPFVTVLKDGFFEIACAKDYLLNFGDKFGDGKDSYKLADVSNVSIVHYESFVIKEDRKPMTHEICFEFCRTVPDMLVFGIHNGRDCYCAPYFEPMESDSTECDAVCPGNPTMMCGGKFKSSVFEMHECEDTKSKLEDAGAKAATVLAAISESIEDLEKVASGMQASASEIQKGIGAVGDPAASDLMQTAKVFAGELEHFAEAQERLKEQLKNTTDKAAGMTIGNSGGFAETTQAEALTRTLEKLTVDAEDATEALDAKVKATSPSGPEFNASAGAAGQYYPLLYFVDKKYVTKPATCTGDVVGKPYSAVTVDECAHACDAEIHSCVGFSFFPGKADDAAFPSLCFLLSKVTEVTYYTGCPGFLQTRASAATARNATAQLACMAKFSKFDGTSVKPDGSGKCEGCLRKATNAARCPTLFG